MIVYVLTSGEYSDYRILAVAIDAEKAKLLQAKLNPLHYNDVCIEEYDTKEFDVALKGKLPAFHVRIDTYGNAFASSKSGFEVGKSDHARAYFTTDGIFHISLYAKSEKAACKIAVEARAKMLYAMIEAGEPTPGLRPHYIDGKMAEQWAGDAREVQDE